MPENVPALRIEEAALLAGGESLRMGRDKALVEIDGISLLERGLRSLSRRFPRLLLSAHASRLGSERDRILESLIEDGIDVVVVPDRRSERLGPLAALEAVLDAARGPGVLVAPIDARFEDLALEDLLVRDFERAPELRGLIARWSGGLEPLRAVYSRSLLPELRARLERRDLAVRGLVSAAGVATIAIESSTLGIDPARLFVNYNE
jgi:molybdopterin-guanine dinucleotide biosynthesis protein A